MKKSAGELPRPESQETQREMRIDISILSSPEFETFLSDSTAIIRHAAMTQQEVKTLIEKRGVVQKNIESVRRREEKIRQALDQFRNPLDAISPADYDDLVKAKLLSKEDAKKFHALDTQIQIARQIPHSARTQELNTTLEQLSDIQSKLHEGLQQKIREHQAWITERIETAKNTVAEIYTKRVHALESAITEIDAHPRVVERLKQIAEDQKEREKAEKLKISKEMSRILQSLRDRHANAFERLAKMTGNPNLREDLHAVLDKKPEADTKTAAATLRREQMDFYKKVQDQLIRSISIEEGDEQLKSLREVNPGFTKGVVDYDKEMEKLSKGTPELLIVFILARQGNTQAIKLLEEKDHLLRENSALHTILDATNVQGKKVLIATIEKRIERDKSGETKKLQEAHKERVAEQKKVEAHMESIVKRGGFYVDVPQGGGRTERGAVLLEKSKGAKGIREFWNITEAGGAAKDEKLVGKSSPLSMTGFPGWIRAEADKYFARSGADFTERIAYDEDSEK